MTDTPPAWERSASFGPFVSSFAGAGPVVLLVHGVGVGPLVFDELAGAVAVAGFTAEVVHRPAYGLAGAQPWCAPADQVGWLADRIAAPEPAGGAPVAGAPVAGVVGVGGGATLALLVAVRLAERGASVPVVAHEPLLGPLAPALHHRTRRAVSALGPAGRPPRAVATTGYVRRLVGEATWARLPAAERDAVAGRSGLIADEARGFAGLAPTATDLARLRGSAGLTTTYGATSGGERRSAASVLSSLSRARVEVVPGAGHLAQVDAPAAFASTALTALAAGAGPALGAAS